MVRWTTTTDEHGVRTRYRRGWMDRVHRVGWLWRHAYAREYDPAAPKQRRWSPPILSEHAGQRF
jgi:hypothetical protein